MRLMGWFSHKKFEWDSFKNDEVQNEVLNTIISNVKNTRLGHDLKLSDVRTIEDFRERVPLTTYPFYESYIELIKKGGKNIMTAEDVNLLGVTSGTSGRRCLLPHVQSVQTTFFFCGITLVFDQIFSKAFPEADQLQRTLKLTFVPKWHYTEGFFHARIQLLWEFGGQDFDSRTDLPPTHCSPRQG